MIVGLIFRMEEDGVILALDNNNGNEESMKRDRVSAAELQLRPVREEDMEFLYRVYASTRMEEMAATGWSQEQTGSFLEMQFRLQHHQYRQNYPSASFEIILLGGEPVGRLYVARQGEGMRVVDIALLPEQRRMGIGGLLLRRLIAEAEAKKMTMSLHVETNNPVLPFYRALGFAEIELRGIYCYMVLGGRTVNDSSPARAGIL